MRCSGLSVIIALLGLAGTARADPNYTWSITLAKGKLVCGPVKDAPQGPAAGDATALQIKLVPQAGLAISALKTDPTTSVTHATDPADKSMIATIALGAAPPDKLKLTVSVTGHGEVVCDGVQVRIAAASPAAKPATAPAAISDDVATRWWLSERGASALDALRRAGAQRGLPEDVQFLVHTPSGQPVFPHASSLREGTPVQIVMIQSSDGAPTVDVVAKTCAAYQAFRVVGDAKPEKQSAPIAPELAVHLELSAKGPYLRCGAGSMTYDLTLKAGDAAAVATSHTLDIRPVYSFALLTALGFDTTISHDFQAVAARDGNGNIAAAKHDRVGPGILIGGQWMIGGVDYTQLRWYNYLANPFVAFNASSPLTGFVVGDTLTTRGGISFAIGLAVHQGTRLKGVAVGDPLATGDVPKDATWHEQRLGLFLGVAFDSKVYDALKAR
jgi:hypothetical protein